MPIVWQSFSLHHVKEQANRVQGQLDEEQLKNRKLSQEIAKLEEHLVMMSQEADRKDEVECFLIV